MILRIFRGRIDASDRDRIVDHLRDRVYVGLGRIPGLRSFQSGLRDTEGAASEFVIISTWDDFERLVETLGSDLERPGWMHAVHSGYEPVAADHYELVGEEVRGLIPLEGGVLHVFTGTLRPGTGEAFFETARRRQTEMLDAGLVLASHIGRRIVGRDEEVTYVVLWRDPGAVAGDDWDVQFASWRLDVFDALTRVHAPSAGAPAVLLADDERRFIFATPGAGTLLDRPVGRILGMRVDDISSEDVRSRVDELWSQFLAVGQLVGPFEILRPDGEVRSVGYAARANVPWPGCHASLLVDGRQPTLADIDLALAAAGIIARYAAVEG